MAIPTYRSTKSWLTGLKATDVPVVAFGGGRELRDIDTKPLVGNLAAWNLSPFDNPTNKALSPIIARMPKRTSCRMPIVVIR